MNNAEREAVEKKQAGDPNELDTSRLHFLLLAFQRKSTNADTGNHQAAPADGWAWPRAMLAKRQRPGDVCR